MSIPCVTSDSSVVNSPRVDEASSPSEPSGLVDPSDAVGLSICVSTSSPVAPSISVIPLSSVAPLISVIPSIPVYLSNPVDLPGSPVERPPPVDLSNPVDLSRSVEDPNPIDPLNPSAPRFLDPDNVELLNVRPFGNRDELLGLFVDLVKLEFHRSIISDMYNPPPYNLVDLGSICPRWNPAWKVYEGPKDARKSPLHTKWALRASDPEDDDECCERLLHEVEIYEQFASGQNVCQYHGCLVKDGYVVGIKLESMNITLKDQVEMGFTKHLSDPNVFIADIRSALEYIESLGLVYVDLNPSNIMHSLDHGWCLVDFEHVAPLGTYNDFVAVGGWALPGQVYDCDTKEIQLANLRRYIDTSEEPNQVPFDWDFDSSEDESDETVSQCPKCSLESDSECDSEVCNNCCDCQCSESDSVDTELEWQEVRDTFVKAINKNSDSDETLCGNDEDLSASVHAEGQRA